MQAWADLVRGRSASGFGWVWLVLVVGLSAGVAGMSAGAAASMAARLASLVRVAPRAEFGLSQAPAGLRVAVRRALGVRAASGGSSQRAELTASGGTGSNRFGLSVAVSGSTAVVGAPSNNSRRGAAYVFVRSRMGWSKQAKLTA